MNSSAIVRRPIEEPGVYYAGRFRVCVEWDGQAFAYEVCSVESDSVIRSGFDMLSLNEEAAVEGILTRLGLGVIKAA